MSGIGSLGLDSTLRYFMQGTKHCHRYYWWYPREFLYRQPRVAPRSFSLQKICALEKKQAAKKLIISSCAPTTSALLLYHYYTTAVYGLYILPTMLRYERIFSFRVWGDGLYFLFGVFLP